VIRRTTGRALNRTQFVRALIDALDQSGLNVSGMTSESDLTARLRQKLAGR
jgi:hypothetical protein